MSINHKDVNSKANTNSEYSINSDILKSKEVSDVAIIGSGPAGLSAAIYAVRAGLSVTVFMGDDPKGQLMTTTDIENYPGFIGSAPDLMHAMEKQAVSLGCVMENKTVSNVFFDKKTNQKKIISGKHEYNFKSCILATGAKAKYLGLQSEYEYLGYGVSTCATCDGFFFKDLEIAVVGGGNTAIEEAIYLSKIAKKVHLIHRRQEFRAEKIMQERMLSMKNIYLHLDCILEEVLGNSEEIKSSGSGIKAVSGARIKNVKTGSTEDLNLQGVFIAIGHSPQSSIVSDLLDLDTEGYVITDGVKTKIPGFFVAGDVMDKVYRQAVTASGQGCMAAMETIKYFQEHVP
ncbi:thioredoxin-disulfide reductase [Candidatus Nesciobacter abundans]|uniref:Thioredoxin reductase n=1 Tax=Candidatus Nesciobacter abundans TaxID=2601668 RepID=A0A5C0UH51_9PROT|nr:thioredoxin-disulfide reductase [Candidatus Nesciobacter abundans]QEK39001.1 thioredoxin-disulfide reductase [Candidatus Nesciobacter abundans]